LFTDSMMGLYKQTPPPFSSMALSSYLNWRAKKIDGISVNPRLVGNGRPIGTVVVDQMAEAYNNRKASMGQQTGRKTRTQLIDSYYGGGRPVDQDGD
jgi:hypothetical protein